jgi:hypothetical protein
LLAHRRGEETDPWIEKLNELFSGEQSQAYGRFLLAKARVLPPKQALKSCQEALKLAQQNDWPALQIAAHALYSQILLQAKRHSEALVHSQTAMQLLEHYWPAGCSRLEVLWTHYRAQAAHRQSDKALLRQVLDYLLQIAENHVPPQHRQSFLRQNLLSKEIVQAAQAAGIATT